MKYWFIRVYEPAKNKGEVDKMLFCMNYRELDDLLDFIGDLREKIILKNLKISITLKEVNLDD